MIYIKRILFLISAILIFLSSVIPFLISALITPLYACYYYVKYEDLQDMTILPVYVADFHERLINKINPD